MILGKCFVKRSIAHASEAGTTSKTFSRESFRKQKSEASTVVKMKLGTVSLQKMKSEVIRVLPADNISEDAPVVQKCFYCSTDQEIILCNWCRQVYFCRKHQSIHRSRSKCFPFVVCRSEHDGPLNGHGLGGGRRKLLASRDIRAGKNFLN